MMRRRSLAARRLQRRGVWLAAAAVLMSLLLADARGWLLVRHVDDLAAYHGRSAQVNRIIDGDTLDVNLPDDLSDRPATRIRLWGVDCPEMGRNGQASQPWARESSDRAVALAEQQTVLLWLEPHQTRDAFGRVLAHIELPDGTILNETLLAEGLAKADDRWAHTRLTRYAQLELSARRRSVGVWRED